MSYHDLEKMQQEVLIKLQALNMLSVLYVSNKFTFQYFQEQLEKLYF